MGYQSTYLTKYRKNKFTTKKILIKKLLNNFLNCYRKTATSHHFKIDF